MYEVVREFLERLGSAEQDRIEFSDGDKRVALAVLLYRMVTADGRVQEGELTQFRRIVGEYLQVSPEELVRFEESVQSESQSEQSLFPYTVIVSKMPMETRRRVLELMREISMSDRELHEFEINLMARTAELLGVETN